MRIGDGIKRVSYSPLLGACIRPLGLRRVMQWTYAKWRGNPSVVKFSTSGVDAIFSARTAHELRCVEGTWFTETEMLDGVLSRLQSGDVFLDVGSNLGVFSVFAAKKIGPNGVVMAFEPETIAHTRLVENVRLNDLNNVRVFKLALSDIRETRKLVLGDPGSVSQSAHLGDDVGPSEVVETVDYDWLVASQALPIPRVIKMDIEGHEAAAIKGMSSTLSNPSCEALFCEIHPLSLPKGVSADQVLRLIKANGFDSIHTTRRAGQVHSIATKTTAM